MRYAFDKFGSLTSPRPLELESDDIISLLRNDPLNKSGVFLLPRTGIDEYYLRQEYVAGYWSIIHLTGKHILVCDSRSLMEEILNGSYRACLDQHVLVLKDPCGELLKTRIFL